jgi:hypothetical protein
MGAPTPSPVVKPTTTTPKSSYSRNSSYTAPTTAKRHCKLLLLNLISIQRIIIIFFIVSFEGDSNGGINEPSTMSGKFFFSGCLINSSVKFLLRYQLTNNTK